MGFQKIERSRKFVVYEYDAAVDGGSADTYNMRPLVSSEVLEDGLVLMDGFLTVETGFTDTDGMSAATIDVGDGTDEDRWFDTSNVAAASAGDVVGPETDLIRGLIGTGEATPVVTIGGGGLDAGKIYCYFEYVKPL